jgi:hypothetical protein
MRALGCCPELERTVSHADVVSRLELVALFTVLACIQGGLLAAYMRHMLRQACLLLKRRSCT